MVVMLWVIPITQCWGNGRVGKVFYLAHAVDVSHLLYTCPPYDANIPAACVLAKPFNLRV